ncbi:recombinase family protein [Ruminococcus sp. 25CYCFAH16]
MPAVTVIQPTLTEEKTAKIRCAAYCRVSSDSEDQLNSFMAQTRYYSQLFEDSEAEELIDIYADEGITGTREDKRGEFKRMMKDCRRGKIDRIYTKSISRFARNTKDCLKNVRELKSLGITIFFEKENIDTAKMTDEMMITIMGGLAQEESTSISQNLRWGIKKRMENGTIKMCTPLFGYDLVNGELALNSQEAEIVRQVFDCYLNGSGTAKIAKTLNSLNVQRKGKPCHWTAGTVKLMLTNEKYIGDQLFQKYYTTVTLPFRHILNKGECEQYYYSKKHEPIISREDFDKVQALIKQRSKYFGNTEFKQYPLSMKVFCGNCGKLFKRIKIRGKIYWVCRTHNNRAKDCTNKAIVQELIYDSFIRLYNKLYFNYKEILLPLHTALQNLKLRKFSGQAQVMEVRKEIAKLREQSHVLARLKTKGFLDEAKYIEQTAELTAKINKLQTELKKLTRSDNEDETLNQIEMLIDFFEKQDDPITKFEESEFESIVDKIVVINQHELEFHLIGGLKFKEKI